MTRFFYLIFTALWLLLASSLCANAWADSAIDTWRNEANATRMLAENNAQAAYQKALYLQTTLPANAAPADQAHILNLLSRIEVYTAQIESSANHSRQALELAKKNGDRIGQAEAYLNISLSSVFQSQLDDLVEAAPMALKLLEGVDRPDLLGEAMLRLAMMYRRTGLIDESVTLCMQAMEIAQSNNDPLALLYAHQGLGISYAQSEHYEKSLDHYTQLRDLAQTIPLKQLEADATLGIATALQHQGELRKAELINRKAIELSRAHGAHLYTGRGLFTLAEILVKQGRLADSLPLLDEIIAIYEPYRNKIGLWWTLKARSENLQSMGRLTEAQADAERAYTLAKDIGLSSYQSDSARRMAEVIAATGDYKQAYRLSSEAIDLEAKSIREKSSSRMLELAQRYKSEQKQQQIDRLTLREQHRILQQRWLWTILGGSIALLAVSTYFLMRLRRSHRLIEISNKQLLQSKNEIRSLNIDLEQRVQARTDELRQQTRYLRTLVDTLPVSVWLKDTESRYLTINTNNAITNGYTIEQIIGKTDLELWPGDVGQSFRATDFEVMDTRQSKTFEVAIHGPDGTVFWREIDKAPVIDEDGTILGIVGVGRDISERKAAEAAREAALTEAVRLAKLRSEFIAYMSHELRTPLNGILGYTQLLQRDKTIGERNAGALDVIRQSGEHLLAIVEDILDLARIETGRLELIISDIPLHKFLSVVAEIVSVKACQKALEFNCDLAADLPETIRGDEKRLRQVLLNLLANAVKFTDQGRVVLRVSRVTSSRLCFVIQDTGVGIEKDKLETIFQHFEQSGDVQQRSGGTGLGLAISRQLVRLMGSDIGVESHIGEGSTFRFELELPTVEVMSAPLLSVRVTAEYAGPRRKILIVDDAAENRAESVKLLVSPGFDTIAACDGGEALKLAQSTLPDLILMNYTLSGMSGRETMLRLRQWSALVPIVVFCADLSGYGETECMAAGANAFIPEPIDRDTLQAHIAALLNLEQKQPSENSATTNETPEPLIFPPTEDMQTLYRLAQLGNMRDIMRYAERIADTDPRYGLFATQLRRLAEGYQSKAILAFAEQHLNDASTYEISN